jgi:hypothetical protein
MVFGISHNARTLNKRPITTELRLTDAIAAALRDGSHGGRLPRFDALYKEVRTRNGIADVVGVTCLNWAQVAPRLKDTLQDIPRGPVAEILAKLSVGPRRKSTLLNGTRSGLSRGVIEAALRALSLRRIVLEDGNLLRLSGRLRLPEPRLYSFEVKLSDWRRAAFQAMQASSYAYKSYCIFPIERAETVRKNRQFFADLGLGVLLFDFESARFTELSRGKGHSPYDVPGWLDVTMRLAKHTRRRDDGRIPGIKMCAPTNDHLNRRRPDR